MEQSLNTMAECFTDLIAIHDLIEALADTRGEDSSALHLIAKNLDATFMKLENAYSELAK